MKLQLALLVFVACLVSASAEKKQVQEACVDKAAGCAEMMKSFNGRCVGRMNGQCKKSCNKCPVEAKSNATAAPETTTAKPAPTTQEPTTTTGKPTTAAPKPTEGSDAPTCEDMDPTCAEIVKRFNGRCLGRVSTVCRKTCNKCAQKAVVPVTTTSKPEPTTSEPTTTTEKPTTTTPKPTTLAPTTQAPTTQAPKTEAPKTEAPTTEAPTTEVPTTESPTTETPITEAATTSRTRLVNSQCRDHTKWCPGYLKLLKGKCDDRMQKYCKKTCGKCSVVPAATTSKPEPTTAEPTTITEKPSTTTPKPSTHAPTTQALTTESPKTEAPATEAPATEAATTSRARQGKSECRDYIRKCTCTDWRAMLCKKTCGKCTVVPAATTFKPEPATQPPTTEAATTSRVRLVNSKCYDYSWRCPGYLKERGGKCDDRMQKYCKKTCGKCGVVPAEATSKPEPITPEPTTTTEKPTTTTPKPTTEAPTTEAATTSRARLVNSQCSDKWSKCEYYLKALKGKCTDRMEENCKKTCEKCGEPGETNRERHSWHNRRH